MVPVAQHAQAFEIFALLVNLLGGISAAFGLHLVTRQFAAKFLLNCVLNRQAVAVPARNVGGVHVFQLARLDDHVFQDLVDGMAHVNLAIGVGRAVVQHKLGVVAAGGAQFLVNALLFPLFDPLRLPLGQVAAHRERGVGQVQGAAVVGFAGGLHLWVLCGHVGERAK